jgi:very-short-patch-repair endonuclease
MRVGSFSSKQLLIEARAHSFRFALTRSEAALWRELSGGKLGVAFRRQVPLGGFIADFYAPAKKLVVEVDGAWHRRRVSADARRDRKLARLGCRVLRLEAKLVLENMDAALDKIRRALDG